MERRSLAVPDEAGVPLAFVSCRDASVLLGNGLEGGPSRGFWSKEPASACGTSQPRGCLLSFPHGATLTVASTPGIFLACCWILTSTGLSLPPLPSGHRFLSCFRELCLGLHIFSSPGFFCWMMT